MSKKVLIVSSSPRKGGNSDTLCNEFLRGATESGHQAEKVFLRDQKIGYCTGCGVCNSTHACVQKDNMAALLQKMLAADVIVMATPVYFYTMDAQMKTFIDRTVPVYTQLSGKDFYFIMTAADGEKQALERTLDGFRGFTDCLDAPREKGVIYATGVWQTGEVTSTAFMEQAYQMGRGV